MRRRAVLGMGLALPVLVTACHRPPAPSGPAAGGSYLIGGAYQMGGVWSYPKEDFGLQETGLASVVADPRAGRRTANGEVHDPALLTAAHRTLQLPAILRVTNLENGLSLLVRVNDRGPQHPGRVLELSRRAADLLRIPAAGGAQIALAVEPGLSRALSATSPQDVSTVLAVATAPRGALEGEALAPLPGTRSQAGPAASPPGRRGVEEVAAPTPPPLRLPEEVVTLPPRPGRMVIQAGTFFNRADAQRQAARIGARVESHGPSRRPEYRVRLGPYASVAQADTALEAVLRSGLSEARILID